MLSHKTKVAARALFISVSAFLLFAISPAPDIRSAGIQGPITHAETDYSTGADAGTAIVAPVVSHTTGNLIAVFISGLNPGAMRVDDTQGNTYTAATTATNHGATGQWFYTFASATGDNTVTGTFTNSATYRFIRVLEYSGISTTNPVDVQGAGVNSSATSPSFTTTSANELILVGWHTNTPAYCYAGEGYTLVPNDYCKESIARPVEQRIVSSIQTNATASIVQTGNAQGGWVVSFRGATGETIAETPAFSVAEGSYNAAQSVTISTATSGATICYTTDGTTPASSPAGTCAAGSTTNSGAISVATSTTIKAIATKSGMSDSYIGSAEYVISSITRIMDIEASDASSATDISASTTIFASHTAGNLIAVFVAATNPLSISIADTQLNSYTAAADAYALSAGGMTGRWFYTYASVTDSNTITATFGQSATNRVIHAYEYAGIAPSSPLDIHTEYTKAVTPLFTTSAPDEVILSAWYVTGGVSGSACYAGHGYGFTAGSYDCTATNAWPIEERIATSIQTNASASLGHSGTGTTSGSWTVSFKGAVAPAFSPEEGLYGSSQNVALSTTMTGATICYTTDGTTPTTNGAGTCVNGSAYSTAIAVGATTTIRAVATVNGGSDSVVSSATYTIDSSKLITFTTTATSFTPIIEVDGNPLIQWDFGSDATSARYSHLSTPTATYADGEPHTVTLVVTPWSAVNTINIGYSIADGGTVNIQALAQQNVTAVAGLANVAPYLRAWASYQNPIATLNFSNFSKLETIESGYNDSLGLLTLTGTSSLRRLSVEECGGLTSLDLSESPLLGDLRDRDSLPVVNHTITWGTTGKYLWHLCVAARNMQSNFPMEQFTNLEILYANSADQDGVLHANSTHMTGTVMLNGNNYTEAYFTGAFASGANATLQINGNRLTVLDVSDDPGLVSLDASDNDLSQAAIDKILGDLDENGNSSGTAVLTGNTAPSSAGQVHIASLEAKSWTVTTDAVAAASPSFAPAAGEYNLAQTITLSTATSGASIYYTVDGSTPTTSSTLYSTPFTVSSDMAVKAIAVKDGYADSPVARASYDIQGPVTQADTAVETSSSTTVASPSVSHTAGNLIAVFVGTATNSVTISRIDDTQLNTYTAVGSAAATCGGILGQWFYTFAGATGSNTVTATFSAGATYRTIRVLEYAGIDSASPLDFSAVPNPNTDESVSSYFTTNNANDLILAAWHASGSTTTCTAGNGYSMLADDDCGEGDIARPVEQRVISSILTNTNATIENTAGATSGGWIVGFKLASVASPVSLPAFSVAEGTYNTAQSVTLSSSTAGAIICYTVDGTTPQTDGAGNCTGASTRKYSGAIDVSSSATIKAVATKVSMTDSKTASAEYVISGIQGPITYVKAGQVSGPGTTITSPEASHTAGNLIAVFIVTNGNPGTIEVKDNHDNLYNAVGTVNAPQSTLYGQWFYRFASATESDTVTATFSNSVQNYSINVAEYSGISQASPVDVIASGPRTRIPTFDTTYQNELILTGFHAQNINGVSNLTACSAGIGWTLNDETCSSISRVTEQRIVSSIQSNYSGYLGHTGGYFYSGWTVSFKGADTPIFSVNPGNYSSAQNVTLSSTISGATICYTTNGADPTTDGAGACTGTTLTYSSAISVSEDTTIKAVATKSGRSDTAIASAIYRILPAASAPAFSVAAGTYTYGQTVALSTATSGATICYTTDGTDPTTDGAGTCVNGRIYSAALSVSQPQTVKAIATMNGYGDSTIASAAYVISGVYGPVTHTEIGQQSGPGTSVSAPAATHTAGNLLAVFVVTNGNPGTTTINDTQANSYTSVAAASAYGGHSLYGQWFYAAAGSTGSNTVTATFTNSVQNYNIRVLEYANVRSVSPLDTSASGAGATTPVFTTTYANDLILAGFHAQWVGEDDLTACSAGTGYTLLANDYCSTNIGRPVVQKIASSILTDTTASIVNTGGTVYSGWAIALKGEDPVAFTPAAGTYNATQSVALSSTISGATICYTTDGTTPTTDGAGACTGTTSTYSSAISVASSATVKAVATKSGRADSAIANAAYVIDIKPAFSLAAGTYPTAKNVTLTVDNADATICYTTDGATPTTDGAGTCTGTTLTYSAPVNVSNSMTIKAIATESGIADSSIASASYVINASQAIAFTTTGSTFAPEITVTGSPTIYWEFSDGTTSNSATPNVNFGTAATRTQYLVVTPWNAVTVINLGYDAGDSGTAPISLIAQQNVSAVAGLSNVASSLQIWASSHNPLDSLVFSNFTALTTIECYKCNSLDSITLVGTSALTRLNLENNHLESLDLSQVPNLEDLRGTSNEFTSITWPEAGMPYLWHLCAHSMNLSSPLADLSKFPALIQLWIRNDTQTGTLHPVSTHLTSIWGQNNDYSAGDFTGNFPEGNSASLYMQYNELTSLILADDPGLIYVDAYGNHLSGLDLSGAPNIDRLDLHDNDITSLDVTNSTTLIHLDLHDNLLTSASVNDILTKIDGFGTYGGYLNLGGTGNAAPSFAAQIYAQNLRLRGWIVETGENTLSFGKAGNGGTGTVTITDGTDTITCGSGCTSEDISLSSGSLTLSATADTGSVFTGWSGGGCTGTGTCTISLSTDTDVTATFSTTASGIHGPITQAKTVVYRPDAATLSAPTVTHTQKNLIAVFLGVHENTGALGITDTQGNTYTAIGSPALVGGDITGQWFYAFAGTTSLNTVTATFNGSYSNLRVLEYSGIDPTSPVDAIVTGTGGTLAFSTTVADELVLASWHTGATTCTPGTGFTRIPMSYCNSQVMRPAMQGVFSSIQTGTSATMGSTGGSISGGWLVSFKGGDTAAAPTFNPAAGALAAAQDITLSTTTPGANIYYTTDDSMPTTASSVYSTAIPVSSATTIRAIATATGYAPSGISMASYTIMGTVETPTFSPAAGTYTSAQSVALATTTAGASICYTTDGTDPTASVAGTCDGNIYSTAIPMSSTATVKAIATKSGMNNSAIASATYTITGTVATPTFSPAAGTYTSAQSVTLESTTAGASIYYTTDGSAPSASSTSYSSAISISASTTLKAIALKADYDDSAVASAAYTINISSGGGGGGGGGAATVKPTTNSTPVASVTGNQVTLSFSVNDAAWMAFSSTNDFSDAAWEKYSSSASYIKAEGQTVLYIKFKSSSGGTSAIIEISLTAGGAGDEEDTEDEDNTNEPDIPATYPDGTLFKTPDSPKVYVIIEGKKKWISTPEVFEQLGYAWSAITVIDTASMDEIPDYEDNLIRISGDYKIYLVTNGVKRHIPNPEVFLDYGFRWEDVKDVGSSVMDRYVDAYLIRETGTEAVYFLTPKGVKKHIPTADIFDYYGDRWEDVQIISRKEMESYPLSQLIKLESSPDVYLIENGTKKLIPDPDTFAKYGFDWTHIITVNDKEFDWYQDVGVL